MLAVGGPAPPVSNVRLDRCFRSRGPANQPAFIVPLSAPTPTFSATCAGGLLGLLGGIRRGAIGVVVLPLASLLEMLASTADSIRRAVAGSSNVGWVRPPRWVHCDTLTSGVCGTGQVMMQVLHDIPPCMLARPDQACGVLC